MIHIFKLDKLMEKRKGTVIIFIAFVSFLLIFSSCFFSRSMRVNENNEATVEVTFDWSDVEGEKPNNMSLWFFPKKANADGTFKAVRRDINNAASGLGTIKVPLGEYDVICVNNDDAHLEYRNDANPYEFEVVIKNNQQAKSKIAMRVGGKNSTSRSDDGPKGVWCGTATTPEIAFDNEVYKIELKPEAVATVVTVSIIVPTRLDELSSMIGSYVGANCIYRPFEKKIVEDISALNFSMELNVSNKTITGAFQNFAHQHSEDCMHTLELYCELKNGLKYKYAYNIKNELIKAKAGDTIHLNKEGFLLPVGQDLSFNIKDWTEIDINP